MSKLAWACSLLAVHASAVRSQGLDRSKRPIAEAAAPLRFPIVVSESLPNGLRIRLVEDRSVPAIAVRAVLGADSTFDPPGKEGLYAVTMGAMRDATATLTTDRLAAAAAALGTAITPTSFTTTTGSFGAALSIMGEMLTSPAFDSAVVERWKAIHMAAARRVAQTPSSAARHLFYQLLYGADDPFTRSLIPTEASVRAISRDDVRRFYDQSVSPATTTLVITGDVSAGAALAEVRRVFGKWESKSGATVAGEAQWSLPREATAIHLIDAPGQQAYV